MNKTYGLREWSSAWIKSGRMPKRKLKDVNMLTCFEHEQMTFCRRKYSWKKLVLLLSYLNREKNWKSHVNKRICQALWLQTLLWANIWYPVFHTTKRMTKETSFLSILCWTSQEAQIRWAKKSSSVQRLKNPWCGSSSLSRHFIWVSFCFTFALPTYFWLAWENVSQLVVISVLRHLISQLAFWVTIQAKKKFQHYDFHVHYKSGNGPDQRPLTLSLLTSYWLRPELWVKAKRLLPQFSQFCTCRFYGRLRMVASAVPLESSDAECCFQETGMTFQKYAYLWVKGCYSISISYAIACVKLMPNTCWFVKKI